VAHCRKILTILAVWMIVPAASAGGGSGVVVESVTKGGPAALAGLKEGDVLLEWAWEGAPPTEEVPDGGSLNSMWDFLEVCQEHGRRKAVRFTAASEAGERAVVLPANPWQISALARMDPETKEAFLEARGAAEETPDLAVRRAVSLSEACAEGGGDHLASWILYAVGTTLYDARHFTQSVDLLRRIEQMPDASVHPYARVLTPRSLGNNHDDLREYEQAGAFFEMFEERCAALLGDSPCRGVAQNDFGVLLWLQGDLEGAKRHIRESLDIYRRIVPDTLAEAQALNNLGVMEKNLGDYHAAQGYYEEALPIYERVSPGSTELAKCLNNMGIITKKRGDYTGAERYYRESLAIRERLEPGNLSVGRSYLNLGILLYDRGDHASAEGFYLKALEIFEREEPVGQSIASCLNSLAIMAMAHEDFEAAEGFYLRSLAIKEQVAPESVYVAVTLDNLAGMYINQGRTETGEALLRRSLGIKEKAGIQTPELAVTLVSLANARMLRGDEGGAMESVRRAVEIHQRLAPEGIQLSGALSLRGRLEWNGKRYERAIETLYEAVDVIELQRENLGGTAHGQYAFTAHTSFIYKLLVRCLVERGRKQEAFEVDERSRAVGLRMLLAERDLLFDADIPAALDRERRSLAAQHDRVSSRLAGAVDEKRREHYRRKLLEIRAEQERVRAAVREASPRLAGLQYPEPPDLDAVSEALPEGTLLLSWSIHSRGTVLFSLGPEKGAFDAVPLEIAPASLRRDVRRMRALLREASVGDDDQAVRALGERLGRSLLGPAAEAVAACERLVLIPAGSLHLLPFGALRVVGEEGATWLAEAAPISVVASAAQFVELSNPATADRPVRLAAFGDPDYAAARERFPPLPATRREVAFLKNLFGSEAVTYVGGEATEPRAKALKKDLTLIHFAVHGAADEHLPLDSYLALSIPREEGEDNGLLRAWEIFERMRIDADLVTLSACETALGAEITGEGIVGLTRAFHYAGARSVLASLWKVPDAAAAAFMERFYVHLRAGLAKDHALAAARRDFLTGPVSVAVPEGGGVEADLSHPFFWSGFELFGEGGREVSLTSMVSNNKT